MQIVDTISEKSLKTTISLTAGRGRGKSASLGISLASAIVYGFSNIFVTAPTPENLGSVFEFLLRGLDALNYKEH
jgi:N-acetyltransferase 10